MNKKEKYHFLKALLPYIEEFETTTEETSVAAFSRWIQSKVNFQEATATEQTTPIKAMPPQGDTKGKVPQLLALMHKYLKFYVKKGFEDSILNNADEFGVLATLMIVGKLSKATLIQKNTLEFSSGNEVLKRLERKKLTTTSTDPNDRRARIVEITALGLQAVREILPTIEKIGHVAMGNLSPEEADELLRLLNKLNHFHNPIFHEEKEADIDGIMQRYQIGTELH